MPRSKPSTATKRGAPTPASTGDTRPVIQCTSELADVVDASVVALAARARELAVYQRGHMLVHVTSITPAEADASPVVSVSESGEERHELVAGTPVIHTMEVATLRETLTRCARYAKFDARTKAWRQCIPSEPIVHAVHARKKWLGVASLVGVIEAPFLRPNGSVCETPGFDAATGYLYAPSCDYPRVPDRPTQAQARAAYQRLVDRYADFPFASAANRAVMLSAELTYLARAAICGATPAHALDGNVRGAGKSLCTDTVAVTVTGRAMPRTTYPASEEELRKLLDSFAVEGASLISIDNVSRELGGGALDAYLTARDTVKPRILGSTKTVTVPWRAVMCITGNNLQLYGDTADRLLMARLNSPEENPRRRPRSAFRHPDLLAHVRAQRAQYVVDLLTVLRAYVVAGRPDVGTENWGSFEEWASLIPPALVFAAGAEADPMRCRILDETSVNQELAHIAALVNIWETFVTAIYEREHSRWKALKGVIEQKKLTKAVPPEPQKRSALTCRQLIEELYGERGRLVDDASFDSLREAIEALCCPGRKSGEVRPTSIALAAKLRSYKGRNFGGRAIACKRDAHTDVTLWWVEAAGVAGVAGAVLPNARKLSVLKGGRDTSGNGAETIPATPATPAGRRGGRA